MTMEAWKNDGGWTPPVAVQEVQQAEPSVEEHAQMIQKAFGKVMDKALAHADLTKRVDDLEQTVRRLQNDVNYLTEQLSQEQEAHRVTRGQLTDVQATLAQRESTIHDLVGERDIVLQERNDAQAQRDSARRESNDWQVKYNEAQAKIDEQANEIIALQGKNADLQAKMEAFRNAFRGLAA